MSSAEEHKESLELIVAADGSIPADQLAKFGVRPGQHVRVVEEREHKPKKERLGGSIPDLGQLTWEDFERGSELAQHDLGPA